jgi:hypothetical protein
MINNTDLEPQTWVLQKTDSDLFKVTLQRHTGLGDTNIMTWLKTKYGVVFKYDSLAYNRVDFDTPSPLTFSRYLDLVAKVPYEDSTKMIQLSTHKGGDIKPVTAIVY